MLRLFILLGCLLNYSSVLLGQDLLAGQIRVEQLSASTIKVHFEILTEIHQKIDYLPVCWGDGNCDDLPLVSFEDLSAIDAKYHYFNAFYTYSEQGTYSISTNACCWWDGLANIPSTGDAPFFLHTSFSLVNEFNATYNSTPTFDLPPYSQANFNEILIYAANLNDAEGDSISVKIETIEEVLINDYVLPTAVFANSNNVFSLVENTGNLFWFSPPPIENKYVLCLNVSEYRNETLLSTSQQYIYFMIQEAPNTIVDLANKNEINLFPNPCPERFFLEVPANMSNNIQAIHIYNQAGKLISSHAYLEEGYPITAFSSGIYQIQVKLKIGQPINLFLVKM